MSQSDFETDSLSGISIDDMDYAVAKKRFLKGKKESFDPTDGVYNSGLPLI